MKFKIAYWIIVCLFVVILSMQVNALAVYSAQSTNFTLGSTASVSSLYGIKFYSAMNVTLLNVTRPSGVTDTSTLCWLMNSTRSVLANTTFIGNTCTFNYNLTANVTYYVMNNKSTYPFNISYGGNIPYNNTILRFTKNWDGSTDQEVNPVQLPLPNNRLPGELYVPRVPLVQLINKYPLIKLPSTELVIL